MKKVISVLILLCLILSFARFEISAKTEPTRNPESSDMLLSEKLPNQKCGTMKILETKEKQRCLNSKTGNELATVFSRPTEPGGDPIDWDQHLLPQLYNTTYFVLHWTNGSDGGNNADATNPTYVQSCANAFEYVRNFEVVTRGFEPPPSDATKPNDSNNTNPDGRYDVFIYDMPCYAGYCDWEGQWTSNSSYIGVSHHLGSTNATAAHEFFHAIQLGNYYNVDEEPWWEERWWLETTATYMEDEVYPEINDNYRFLPAWFLYSDTLGLETYHWENYSEFLHPYGNFIWAKCLSEDFGDGIIKEIWEEMAKPLTNSTEGIDKVLISKNSSLVKEFSCFLSANFFLEEMYEDGLGYRQAIQDVPFKGVQIEYQYNASQESNYTEINASNVNLNAWMDKWAADYITMVLDPAKPRYLISFDGLDASTNYLVKLVTKKNENISETPFQLNGTKDGSLELAYDDFQNVTLIIANAGNTPTANPSWRVTITVLPESIYDVAIIDMQSSTSVALTGEEINITIVIKNNGTMTNEKINVSAYWGQFWIENKTIINLSPGATRTWTIYWTIPSEVEGQARLWANATIQQMDSLPENNVFESKTLYIISAESSTGGGGSSMRPLMC